MDKREALIRRYFDACNAADHDALVACFTPDAVHYFPPGLPGAPWRGAEAIAGGWAGASRRSAAGGRSSACCSAPPTSGRRACPRR